MEEENISLTDRVAQKLRESIINFEFKPGEHLTQSIISERFKVSHIPAREALLQLESDGYVKLLPYKGAVIAAVSAEEIEDVLELRSTVEALVSKNSLANFSDASFSKAEKAVAKLLKTKSPALYVKLHNEVFGLIFGQTERPFLQDTYNALNHRVARYISFYLKKTNPAKLAGAPTFEEILAAAKKKDADKLGKLLKKRYQVVADAIKESLVA